MFKSTLPKVVVTCVLASTRLGESDPFRARRAMSKLLIVYIRKQLGMVGDDPWQSICISVHKCEVVVVWVVCTEYVVCSSAPPAPKVE